MFLVGCKETEQKSINMTRYFADKVTYKVQGDKPTETTLSEFIHNNHSSQKQYLSVEFTGVEEWLYKMNIEKVCFEIYANRDMEVQFVLMFSNLSKGDLDSKGDAKFKTIVNAKQNKPVTVTLEINDFVKAVTTTKISLEIDGSQHFTDANEGFKYDIMNFRVYGKQRSKDSHITYKWTCR